GDEEAEVVRGPDQRGPADEVLDLRCLVPDDEGRLVGDGHGLAKTRDRRAAERVGGEGGEADCERERDGEGQGAAGHRGDSGWRARGANSGSSSWSPEW